MATLSERLPVSPIDEALAKRQEPDWHKPTVGRYHASRLVYCLRRQYLDFVSPVTEYDPDRARKTWMGGIIHRAIEDDILPFTEQAYKPIAIETPVYYGLPKARDAMILGRFDVLLEDPTGELAILDMKSREDLYYVGQEGPAEHDVRQLSFYQGATNIERGFIHYIGRRKVDDLFYDVPYSENRFRFMVAQATLLHAALTLKECPEPCPQYGWEPRYCQHRATCPCKEAAAQ